MIETQSQESLHNSEILDKRFDLVGVQGRIILADQKFLDPAQECTPEDLQVVDFNLRNYKPFEQTSIDIRKEYWEGTEKDAAYLRWTEAITETFTHELNQPIVKMLQPILHRAGISSDEPFTVESAAVLYKRYFARDGEAKGQSVKLFVADVIQSYAKNNTLDSHDMFKNIANIQWLANIFGTDAKEMVTQLIIAETKLLTDPHFGEQLTSTRYDTTNNKTVMRINDLTQDEVSILTPISKTYKSRVELNSNKSSEQESIIPKELPIMKHKKEIQDAIRNNDISIIIGATGSGKTIKTPQFIREIMKPGDKLYVTEPRQINTESLAKKIAEEMGEEVGEKIGFRHGDNESDQTEQTDTMFVTEGTLLYKLIKDPRLDGITHVMVDEVHVRSTDTEQLLFYLKRAQELRKTKGDPPLKIILASATVNGEELQECFGGAPIIEVEGRTHPIDIIPWDKEHPGTKEIPSERMPIEAANTVRSIVQSGKEGDMIIFVAGKRDIDDTIKELKGKNLQGIKIIPLHREASQKDKDEAEKDPTPGERRVFVATNFAETGVTIHGLKFVINTGEENVAEVDPLTGETTLVKRKQAQAGVDQRTGRVGRMYPGTVYNLFTQADYDSRDKYPVPEILRTDLTDLILKMKARGIIDISEFKPLSDLTRVPDRVNFSLETLQRLDALNPDGSLNTNGKKMVEIHTEYHHCRMIAEAIRNGRGVEQMCTIAAINENLRGVFVDKDKRKSIITKYRNRSSDYLTYLALWKDYVANGQSQEWANQNGLRYNALVKISQSIQDYMKQARSSNTQPATDQEIQSYITAGLQDRPLTYDPSKRGYRWDRQSGVGDVVVIGRDSSLSGTQPDNIVAASFNRDRKRPTIIYATNCQQAMTA